jgi:outer membrane receptor protein involved in Fe transport
VNQGALQVNYGLEAQNGLTMQRYDNGAPGAVTTFTIRGAGGFGSGIDGSGNTGYEILVLQDGEPLRNGQYGDFDTSSLTPAIYSRVEVTKGAGGSSLFGANTIGGTINLVTRDPAKTEGGEVLLSVGGFGTENFNISETNTLFGRLGYLIDANTYGTNGFVPSNYLAFYGPSPISATCCFAYPTQHMSLQSFLGKLSYSFSTQSYLVLSSSLESDYRDQLGLIGNPNFNAQTGAPIIDTTTGKQTFFGFPGDYVWNMQPKYAADFHTALGGGSLIIRSYSQYLQRVVDGYNEPIDLPCCFLTRSTDRLTGTQLLWSKDFREHTLTVAAGGNGDNFYFGQNPTNPNFPFNGLVVPFSQLVPISQGIEIYHQYLARDDYRANAKLDLTLALNYSDYNVLNVHRLDPLFAAVFKPDAVSVAKLSISTGFAPPRLSDLFTPLDLNSRDAANGPSCSFCVAASGNPNLKAETGVGWDVGYQRLFGSYGQVSVDLYRTNLNDHIFNVVYPAPPGLNFYGQFPGPVTFVSQPINIAGSVYDGLEATATIPASQNFNVGLNYNIQSAYPTGVDPNTTALVGNVVNNQQYLGVPLHKYGWTLNYRNSGNATTFFGANYFAQGNAYNVPPFWQYNAGASIPLGTSSLHITWTNIFNTNAGLWSTFNLGVPVIGGAGYTNGCRSDPTLPNYNTGIYCTSGYNAPAHMLMLTYDYRWGSLR